MGKNASVNMNETGKVRDMRESDRNEGIVTEVKGGTCTSRMHTIKSERRNETSTDRHRGTMGWGKGKEQEQGALILRPG